MSGGGSPRRAASASVTAGPCGPSDASVPDAPPSWSTSASASAACSRPRARSSASAQPAALRPKVTGVACCSQVRPAMVAPAWRRAWAAAARTPRPRCSIAPGTAARSCSTRPVSRTSWLVAPQWTKRAASASACATRAVRRRTTGMTGLPVSVASAARRAGSYSSASAAARMGATQLEGITPTCASAAASAASTSSIAWSCARPEKCAATSASPSTRACRRAPWVIADPTRQTSKNTVSPRPWSRIAWSYRPSPRWAATSVGRRSGSTCARIGSRAFQARRRNRCA